ncbi:hypothetical protein [Streptomyces mirabilis]
MHGARHEVLALRDTCRHALDEARQYAFGLEERALAVHDKARLVHWLD